MSTTSKGSVIRDKPRKTPKDATDFEREQLRFFLANRDAATTLAEVNPSLAWLPVLAELKLIDADTRLAPWIQKNFADPDAVREVAANIHFFGPETGDILEFRLNRTEALPTVLMAAWRLVIRHMRAVKRGLLRDGWFDIAPSIKRGEHSPELLERLAEALRPKLQVSKRIPWFEEAEKREPEQPTDLIAVDFEVEDGISDEDVLRAWPEDTTADVDDKLLRLLTHTLTTALEDAVEAGGESSSDADVPSVAEHGQNVLRTGFFPIVRVTAELWTRLARKDMPRALAFLELWTASPLRLIRRLALFAAANPAMPGAAAAHVLLTLPTPELFLTNSSVEVHRLITARWGDFRPHEQQTIEKRIVAGPPADSFREDAEHFVDRCRFDLLGHMARSGIALGPEARDVLHDLQIRRPEWQLRSPEEAGFHTWHESSSDIIGDPKKLEGVPDTDLIEVAKQLADGADFSEGNAWRALCEEEPARALRGLAAQAATGQWPVWAWRSFLWAAQKLPDSASVTEIGQMLLTWPSDSFSKIAAEASWWLNHAGKTLDESLLWPLWDRIAQESAEQEEEKPREDDALSASLNHSSGRLAEVLLKKLPKQEGDQGLPEAVRKRLDELVTRDGKFGFLARIRLVAAVSFLFEHAPEWTKERIIPLFNWASPDAAAAWSARRYANYIGSQELFALTKQPFLELFARSEISDESLQTFAGWLATIMLANQTGSADYPVSPAEARSSLRRAGAKSLPSVGHRLAVKMERAKADEKLVTWGNVVGPVFRSVWPLDVELQTSASTFKLVQLLLGSGSAFPHAVDVILPFIRQDAPRDDVSVYSLSKADELLYSLSAERMLDLVAAIVGNASSQNAYGLAKVLERIRANAPKLAESKKFQKLTSIANPG